MDVLLRTRGTIEGGVRGVFDVIREIKCKLKKSLFIVRITANCQPESCFNLFGVIYFFYIFRILSVLYLMLFITFFLVPQNIRKMNSNFQILEELN